MYFGNTRLEVPREIRHGTTGRSRILKDNVITRAMVDERV